MFCLPGTPLSCTLYFSRLISLAPLFSKKQDSCTAWESFVQISVIHYLGGRCLSFSTTKGTKTCSIKYNDKALLDTIPANTWLVETSRKRQLWHDSCQSRRKNITNPKNQLLPRASKKSLIELQLMVASSQWTWATCPWTNFIGNRFVTFIKNLGKITQRFKPGWILQGNHDKYQNKIANDSNMLMIMMLRVTVSLVVTFSGVVLRMRDVD